MLSKSLCVLNMQGDIFLNEFRQAIRVFQNLGNLSEVWESRPGESLGDSLFWWKPEGCLEAFSWLL